MAMGPGLKVQASLLTQGCFILKKAKSKPLGFLSTYLSGQPSTDIDIAGSSPGKTITTEVGQKPCSPYSHSEPFLCLSGMVTPFPYSHKTLGKGGWSDGQRSLVPGPMVTFCTGLSIRRHLLSLRMQRAVTLLDCGQVNSPQSPSVSELCSSFPPLAENSNLVVILLPASSG